MDNGFRGFACLVIYPKNDTAEVIALWFRDTFGLTVVPSDLCFNVAGNEFAAIDIMREIRDGPTDSELVIQVRDFEFALAALDWKKIEYENPIREKNRKTVRLKNVPGGIVLSLLGEK